MRVPRAGHDDLLCREGTGVLFEVVKAQGSSRIKDMFAEYTFVLLFIRLKAPNVAHKVDAQDYSPNCSALRLMFLRQIKIWRTFYFYDFTPWPAYL